MYPIVLIHGIARFDILAEIMRRLHVPGLDNRFQYFNGIAPHLKENGFEHVFAPNVDFAGSSALRAAQLKTAVDFFLGETGADKVHIIGHSMGGLDTRAMIVDLKMADRVASLTTIGTPHNGTVLADHLINGGGDDLIRNLQKFIKLDLNGAHDLTETACAELNERTADDEAKNGVFYQTYSSHEDKDRIFAPLVPSFKFILENHGPNDGLVPVDSQAWTNERIAADGTKKEIEQHQFPFPADHLNQTGWWDWEERDGFFEMANPITQKREYEDKVKAVYLEIARRVGAI